MNKFTNILVALGVTLFLLTVGMKSEAEAQSCCPSGLYTQITITNVLNPASGCRFSITYCYYDAPGGDRKIFLCNITIPATQVAPCNLSLFILNSTFWELVNQNILNDFGALMFSPPDQFSSVTKYHKCKDCYENLAKSFKI